MSSFSFQRACELVFILFMLTSCLGNAVANKTDSDCAQTCDTKCKNEHSATTKNNKCVENDGSRSCECPKSAIKLTTWERIGIGAILGVVYGFIHACMRYMLYDYCQKNCNCFVKNPLPDTTNVVTPNKISDYSQNYAQLSQIHPPTASSPSFIVLPDPSRQENKWVPGSYPKPTRYTETPPPAYTDL